MIGHIRRTWGRALLACLSGLAANQESQALTVLALSGSPAEAATPSMSYRFEPGVFVGGVPHYEFQIVNLPSWAAFDAATGQLSGTPADADAGIYPDIEISLVAGELRTALKPFTIAVVAPPPPVHGTRSQMALRRAITISWSAVEQFEDGEPIGDRLAGYVLLVGSDPASLRQWSGPVSAGQFEQTLFNLPAGQHYFALQAYTIDGEVSALSAVVTGTVE